MSILGYLAKSEVSLRERQERLRSALGEFCPREMRRGVDGAGDGRDRERGWDAGQCDAVLRAHGGMKVLPSGEPV
jgi:hypothetical protein